MAERRKNPASAATSRRRGTGRVCLEAELKSGCICTRPKTTLFCKNCGWCGIGRIRTTCEEHERTIYLMDCEQCPICKAFPPLIDEH